MKRRDDRLRQLTQLQRDVSRHLTQIDHDITAAQNEDLPMTDGLKFSMKADVVPDDEGFSVYVYWSPTTDPMITTGFADAHDARKFIIDLISGMAAAARKTN